MFNFDPTPGQKKLIDCDNDALVLAPPGTGKTTVSLFKAGMFLSGCDNSEKILFLSFSRAAVYQATRSLKKNIPPQFRARIEIGTYHSFSLSLVKSFPKAAGLAFNPEIMMEPERRLIWPTGEPSELFKEFEIHSVNTGELHISLLVNAATKVLFRLPYVGQLIGRAYPLMVIDEVQDTSDDEWEFVKSLTKHSRVIYLGDLDQKIFDGIPGRVSNPNRIDQILSNRPEMVKIEFESQSIRHREIRSLPIFSESFLRKTEFSDASQPPIYPIGVQYPNGLKYAVRSLCVNLKGSIGIMQYTNLDVADLSNYLWTGTKDWPQVVPNETLADSDDKWMLERIWALGQICHREKGDLLRVNALAIAVRALMGKLSKAKAAQSVISTLSPLDLTSQPKKIIEKDIISAFRKFQSSCSGRKKAETIIVDLLNEIGKRVIPIKTITSAIGQEYLIREIQSTYDAGKADEKCDDLERWEKGAKNRQIENWFRDRYRVTSLTYFKVKGREFDWVIAVDSPSAFIDSPFSRRVLHVAMTRSRKGFFPCSVNNQTSPLFAEIINRIGRNPVDPSQIPKLIEGLVQSGNSVR